MKTEQLWERWLYERHSRAELATWAPSLRYFRYCRAYGGHANDGDELKVALRCETEEAFRLVCSSLGVTLEHMEPNAPRPIPGVSYRGDEYAKFASFVTQWPHLKQPGHLVLNDAKCFLWVHSTWSELTIVDSSHPYEVTRRCIEGAAAVEPLIEKIVHAVIDPPRDNKHCVCPKFYPELWAARA